MKRLTALILALLIAFLALPVARAQAAETIWIETSQDSYTVGEPITITLKTNTTRSIQGFTYKLRFDPACMQPEVPVSLFSEINYMAVPQTPGQVEAIFASTKPIQATGGISEIHFSTIASCQSSIKLEEARLIIAGTDGMAVPMNGVSQGTSSLVIRIAGAAAPAAIAITPQAVNTDPQTSSTAAPQLTPEPASPTNTWSWLLVPLGILLALVLFIGAIVVTVQYVRSKRMITTRREAPAPRQMPALFVKRGPQSGTTIVIPVFPCRIGSDPDNEICLVDVRIAPAHAEILADEYGYTLLDLGSEYGTYLNGHLVKNQQAQLKVGDTLRLGSIIMMFGPA